MTIENNQTVELEKLRNSIFRIGIQKDGVLTEMSLSHLGWAFGAICPKYKKNDKILSFPVSTPFGTASVHFLRNSDLTPMVANGLLDAAIVGTDMIEENEPDNRISKLRTLSDGTWAFRYMTAKDRPVQIDEARLIGTSYPRIAKSVLMEVGNQAAGIWKVAGSSELLTLLNLGGNKVDGILDISVTGKSASANGLISLGESYRLFKPVLIANYSSLADQTKVAFFKKI